MVTENGLQNRLEIEKLSFWTKFEALKDHFFKELPMSSKIGEKHFYCLTSLVRETNSSLRHVAL